MYSPKRRFRLFRLFTPADPIAASLTTSLTAYNSASTGSWVSITSTEYTALQSNVPSTSVCVSSTDMLTASVNSNLVTGPVMATNSSNTTYSPPIPISNYIYAAVFRYASAGATTVQLYNNTTIANSSNFTAVGNAFPSTTNGYNYAILKGGSSKTGATESYAAIYSDRTVGSLNWIHYKNVGSAPVISGANIRYSAPGAPLTVTTSTNLVSVLSNSVIGLQVLTTSSNIW